MDSCSRSRHRRFLGVHGLRSGSLHGARMNLTRYGILDDMGEIVRWTYEKPTDGVIYLIEITKPLHEIDWDNFEEALF
jgi:hypothetical protein